MKIPFNLHRLPVQMILSFIGVVILTAVAVGVPALLLIREQLDDQAWSQVNQGQRAALALYAARENEIASLATLTAQRPTLKELLLHDDARELENYLEGLKGNLGLDLMVICDPGSGSVFGKEPSPTFESCLSWASDGYHLQPDQPVPWVWLSARHPVSSDGVANFEVLVGTRLDDDFALQMRDQTGLDNSLMIADTIVATSFQGGIDELQGFSREESRPDTGNNSFRAKFESGGLPYYSARYKLAEQEIWAEVALGVGPILASQQRLGLILFFSILVVAILVSILGILLARRISQPLVQLAHAAVEFSNQDLETPVTIDTQVWEVQEVAGALESARVDLQQTVTKLEREKAWVNHLIESIVEGIVTLDQEGKISYFSAGAEEITGWSREQVLGSSFDQVFQLVDAEGPSSDWIPMPGAKKKLVVKLSGERQAVLSFTGARLAPAEAGETQVALVFRDISEEELIRRILGDFLANIAHEFRTPLSAAAASSELLMDQLQDLSQAELKELLNSLHLGILGLQTLVDNLLESASIEAGRFYISPHRSDLGKIIAGAVQLIQPLLDKYGQRLVVELPAEIPVIFADERRIIQVLVNLVSNASKYGPSDEEIMISAFVDRNWVKVQVADCGPGIPIERQTQVFRRFMYPGRVARSEKVGAGLGLSVVKATVEAHGGQVGVQDRPGGGSIFWFSLPMRLEG